jgi:hypothetical protein
VPEELPSIVCTLTTRDAAGRVLEWADLRRHAIDVVRIADGVAITLPAHIRAEVDDLAAREAECCRFLSLVTVARGELVELHITTKNPDGRGVIDLVAGSAA